MKNVHAELDGMFDSTGQRDFCLQIFGGLYCHDELTGAQRSYSWHFTVEVTKDLAGEECWVSANPLGIAFKFETTWVADLNSSTFEYWMFKVWKTIQYSDANPGITECHLTQFGDPRNITNVGHRYFYKFLASCKASIRCCPACDIHRLQPVAGR